MLKRGFGKVQDAVNRAIFGNEIPTDIDSFYKLLDRDMNGKEVPMKTFEGSVLCVVNVSSNCGLTPPNYTQLVQLVDTYGPRGFKVLAFPCNQFAGQEPVSYSSIATAGFAIFLLLTSESCNSLS